MVALNFSVFVDKVERREKRCTIRKTVRGRVGNKVQLYTKMRTKNCRKLVAEDATLKRVVSVIIHDDHILVSGIYAGHWTEERDTRALGEIAQRDGFKSWAEMTDWFKEKYGLPFQGYAHIWHWP